MTNETHKPGDGSPALRSRPSNVFLMKLGTPALLIAAILGVFGDHPLSGSAVLSLPLVFLALFQFYLAQLAVRSGALTYRRFRKWHVIPREEIVRSGIVWPGFIGYIRLRHYLPPFGRLYFVLDSRSEQNPFRPGFYPLLRYLGGQVSRVQPDSPEPARSGTGWRAIKLLGAAAGGAFATLMQVYLSVPLPQPAETPVESVRLVTHLFEIFDNAGVAFVIVLVSGALSLKAPNLRRAVGFAFIGGLFFPRIFSLVAPR